MRFLKNYFKKLLPFFIVVLFLFIRGIWEYLSPIKPDDFKGLIYFRDVVVLFPASFIFCFILLKYNIFSEFTFTFLQKMKFLRPIKKKWRVITIFMAIVIFCLCTIISVFVFKTCAHIVDEANYLFQAKVFAAGKLSASPALLSKEFFKLLYFIQSTDKWYSSFFPGQSVLLAIGVLLKFPFLINPFFTAILLITTVWAGRKIFSTNTGVTAGFLLLCSPFVLFQGASYFSHIFPAILVTYIFVWFLKTKNFSYWKALICGIMTGILLLFRPVSAVVIVLFYLFYYVYQLIKHKPIYFWNIVILLIVFCLGILPGIMLLLKYNYNLTGYYFTTPHQLALPNETIGFGIHSLKNTAINMIGLSVDLLGLPLLSLVPVFLFFFSNSKYSKIFLIFSVMYCLAYSIYPYHGLSYGPRFYFEIVPILLIGSSQVLLNKCSFSNKRLATVFSFLTKKMVIFSLIIAVPFISFLGIIPSRVSVIAKRGEYYDIKDTVRKVVAPPAVVSIMSSDKNRIIPYIAGFQLNSPTWDGDIVFVRYLPEKKQELMRAYPQRRHYILDMDKRIVFPDT